MKGYFGVNQLSATEKSDILNQHKSVYNGYQTMQPEVSNTQPLYVFDAAGDKDGMVINNKGEVKKYTNMGINEQVETKEVCDDCGAMIMDGMCTECNYGHMDEGHSNKCECGGEMSEGVCNECGYGAMEEETGHLDDIYKVRDLNLKKGDFDYVEGGGNDYGTFEGMHKNLYKEQGDDYKELSMYNPYYADDESDFQDYESSYTEDGVEDPDNEDDGYEDINASEVTDGELGEKWSEKYKKSIDCSNPKGFSQRAHCQGIKKHTNESSELEEIDIKNLIKGKKYRYNTPAHQADIEFGDEHKYPEGDSMYSFKDKKDKTSYLLNKKSVEDFMKHLDDDSELEEQSGRADYLDMDDQPSYNFTSGGPDEFGNGTYSEKADDMDLDDEDIKTPFKFKSGGSGMGSAYPVNEDDMYGYDPEKMYEYDEMESAWDDDKTEEELDEIDVSGVQGIYGAMKRAYDFDSEGPGKAGPYQEFSYESKLKEEDDFEEVDEDLKESLILQKNKINEMFNRFKKYN